MMFLILSIYAETGIDRACSPADTDSTYGEYTYSNRSCISDNIELICLTFQFNECKTIDNIGENYTKKSKCKNKSFSYEVFYEEEEDYWSYFFNADGEIVGYSHLFFEVDVCCEGQTASTLLIGTTGNCIEDTGTDDPACGCASAPANPWLIGLFFTTFLLPLRRRVPVHALPEDAR